MLPCLPLAYHHGCTHDATQYEFVVVNNQTMTSAFHKVV